MVGSLGLSETAYGLGASLFFLGYFLFEVPANVFLERVGARIWFARIMITWGIVTVLLGFTQGTAMFLRAALPARRRGGRLLPRRAVRPDPVVPASAPGADDRLVHDRQRHRQRGRCGDRRRAAGLDGLLASSRAGSGCSWPPARRRSSWPRWCCSSCRTAPRPPPGCRRPSATGSPARSGRARGRRPHDHGNPFAALLDRGADARRGLRLPAARRLRPGLLAPHRGQGFGVSNLTNGFLNIIPWLATAFALWWVPRHAARTGRRATP